MAIIDAKPIMSGVLCWRALKVDLTSPASALELVVGYENPMGHGVIVDAATAAVTLGGLIAKMGATVLIVYLISPAKTSRSRGGV